MKTLETEIKGAGTTLRQIYRKGNWALYERSNGNLELIFIHIQPAHSLPNGKLMPEREAYPCNTEWGKYGWSFDAWRKTHVLAFCEKLALMNHKDAADLVYLAMRSGREWIKELGPLRRPSEKP